MVAIWKGVAHHRSAAASFQQFYVKAIKIQPISVERCSGALNAIIGK